MDVVGDSLHPTWELGRVGRERAVLARLEGPAVVDVDVCVAGVLEAQGDKGLGRVQGGGVRRCAASSLVLEMVRARVPRFLQGATTHPAIPAEGGCLAQSIVDTALESIVLRLGQSSC